MEEAKEGLEVCRPNIAPSTEAELLGKPKETKEVESGEVSLTRSFFAFFRFFRQRLHPNDPVWNRSALLQPHQHDRS